MNVIAKFKAKVRAHLKFILFIIIVSVAAIVTGLLAFYDVPFPDFSKIGSLNLYIAFIGVFTAAFVRLYAPIYAKKKKAEKTGEKFVIDNIYFGTFFGSVMIAFIGTIMVFFGFAIVMEAHPLVVFIGSAAYGFSQTESINRIVDWFKEMK